MKRIAVAVDFSPESDRAVTHAMGIARRNGVPLTLVHVGLVPEEPVGLPPSSKVTADSWKAVLDQRLAADRTRLEEMRGRLSGQGVEVSHVVIDGFADHAVAEAARELGADLVVVGTHGRTGFRRLMLGSVAEKTVRLSNASVLVARGEPAPAGYRRVVVGTDYSALARHAVDAALAMVAPGGELHVVNAWHPSIGVADISPEVMVAMHEGAEAAADHLREELTPKARDADVKLTVEVVNGMPAAALDALSDDADLLVVASHGRRGVRRFVLGSVAEATVRHARCSVLVVR